MRATNLLNGKIGTVIFMSGYGVKIRYDSGRIETVKWDYAEIIN